MASVHSGQANLPPARSRPWLRRSTAPRLPWCLQPSDSTRQAPVLMCRSTPAAVATITRPYLATVTNHVTALATLPTRRSGDPELRPGFAQRADKGQRPRRRYLPPEDGPGRGARARWSADGRWIVRARIERFVEPAVLLLLRDGPRHGYDLLERIPDLAGGEGTVDLGNLYRLLRALEREGRSRPNGIPACPARPSGPMS